MQMKKWKIIFLNSFELKLKKKLKLGTFIIYKKSIYNQGGQFN